MSSSFLRFENGKVSIAGKDILANSVSLTIEPSLNKERVFGIFDKNIVGSKVEFINFVPEGGLRGTLNLSFFISSGDFSEDTNSMDKMFDIQNQMSEDPLNNNVVGPYSFDNMFLKSFSFSIKPFSVVEANVSYDIYGSIEKSISRKFVKSQVDFAHSLKSFGRVLISSQNYQDIEISSIEYNISVQRTVHNSIRSSENVAVDRTSSGVVPTRVSVREIEKQVNIKSNKLIDGLNVYGGQQLAGDPHLVSDSRVDIFLLNLNNEKIAKFYAEGKVNGQSLDIQESSVASSSFSINQVIR
jgi:hypothetical protein